MSDLPLIPEIIISALLIVGGFFTLVGSIGLIKLDNCMSRLHAPTKASTLGVGSLLMAAMIYSFVSGTGSLHEILVMAFLFVTAPITGNFIAKVNIHRRACDTPPKPPEDQTWSTLNVPEADLEIEEMTPDQPR